MGYSAKDIDRINAYLEHYGILGMKWGVRRSKKQLQASRGVKSWETEGESSDTEVSNDRKKASSLSKKNVKSLSNDEIREYTTRLQLENQLIRAQQEYKSLTTAKKASKQHKGRSFVMNIAGDVASQLAKEYLKNVAKVQINDALMKNPKTARYAISDKNKNKNK